MKCSCCNQWRVFLLLPLAILLLTLPSPPVAPRPPSTAPAKVWRLGFFHVVSTMPTLARSACGRG